MGFSSWLDRNGTKLLLTVSAAFIAGLFTTVSLLITELGQENRASIAQLREDMRQMRTEMRDEMRANTLRLSEEIRGVKVAVDRLEKRVSRVETRVDELVGLFRFHLVYLHGDPPPETTEP